ncbi:MAG: hypothetical protein EAS51_04720 [Microbacteriaceae bacterium]|nr:MAG: hypothetical protein EAS51_04720 [Microbacteriaceae bacterium]
MALTRSPFRRRPLFADLVADAMLVARAGVRQRVKNVVIMRTLRDGVDFDLAWYKDAVRIELEALAVENETAADQLVRDAEHARGRHFRASTARDYVDRDVPKLRRRRRVHLALAARLRALAEDEPAVIALVEEARVLALDDIASAAAAVPRARGSRPLTGPARRIAIADLLDDLDDLARERDDGGAGD